MMEDAIGRDVLCGGLVFMEDRGDILGVYRDKYCERSLKFINWNFNIIIRIIVLF